MMYYVVGYSLFSKWITLSPKHKDIMEAPAGKSPAMGFRTNLTVRLPR